MTTDTQSDTLIVRLARQNLRKAMADLDQSEMPDQMMMALAALRAQDARGPER